MSPSRSATTKSCPSLSTVRSRADPNCAVAIGWRLELDDFLARFADLDQLYPRLEQDLQAADVCLGVGGQIAPAACIGEWFGPAGERLVNRCAAFQRVDLRREVVDALPIQ